MIFSDWRIRVSVFRHTVGAILLLSAVTVGHAQNAASPDLPTQSVGSLVKDDKPPLLVDAVKAGEFLQARKMLGDGVDVTVRQPDGMTALHWAVAHEVTDLVRRILQAGADPAAVNRYDVSPLSMACQNGDEVSVRMLLKAGADPNLSLSGGETPLMTAARTGIAGSVAALLAAGAKVDARDSGGQSAIMWAAAEGHLEVVDALINAKADYRRELKSGFSPLFFAARQGKKSVVFRLLSAGLDVNESMNPENSAKRVRKKERHCLGWRLRMDTLNWRQHSCRRGRMPTTHASVMRRCTPSRGCGNRSGVTAIRHQLDRAASAHLSLSESLSPLVLRWTASMAKKTPIEDS